MSDNELVSVIMPVFNDNEYLEKSVESILNQTYSNIEFIIVCDPGSDDSLSTLQSYARKKNDIELIVNNNREGIVKSLNIGIAKANGKFIARQDADDISKKERIEKQVSYLKENQNVFLCGEALFNVSIIDTKGNKIRESKNRELNVTKELENQNPIIHSSIMFRNKGNMHYREKAKYTEDYDLYLRLLTEEKRIDIIYDSLVMYRFHDSQISDKKLEIQACYKEKIKTFYEERVNPDLNESYNEFVPSEFETKCVVNSNNHTDRLLSTLKKSGDYDELKEASKIRYHDEIISLSTFTKYYMISKFSFIYRIYRYTKDRLYNWFV